MRLTDVLQIDPLVRAQVVAGGTGVQRTVTWVHIVDLPDPLPWVGRDQFLLTTGLSWPENDLDLRRLISDLDAQGVAGVGLAVPGYLEHAPPSARAEADRVGLPLVEIPWDIPFFEISERINRAMLAEQQLISQQSEAVHRALTRAAIEAESLDDIVRVFSELIQRSVTLEDPDGLLIAAHGDQRSLDRARRETIALGRNVPAVEERLRDLGLWTQMRRTVKPMRIPAQPDIGLASRVVCPVWLKNELVGLVWILEGEVPLGDLDVRAAEHAAIVAALQIARERAIISAETRLGYSLVDSLLEGQFRDDPQSLERALRFGFDPDGAYRVLIFSLGDPGSFGADILAKRDRLVRRLERQVRALAMPPLISVSRNQVTVLVPESVDVAPLWEAHSDDEVRLCVGRVYQGIAGVRQSYLEARSTVPWAGAGSMARYESLLVPRLLKGDLSARKDFVDDMLGALLAAGQGDTGKSLLPTLLVLSECGFNQVQAAERLQIHIKTMHYRYRKLQQIMGKDLADADVRFRVQLLAHLIDLERKEGAV